jgi:TolB-like protein/Tfp pilus assembly protein PilF
MSGERSFFAELKRRNVYKVAAAYVVVSWLLIQAASILFPTFDAPPSAMKILVVILALGFPIALAFSWAFEITPEGLKRESDIDPKQSVAQHTGKKILGLTIALAVIAAGLFAFQMLRPKSKQVEGGSPATPSSENGLAGARPSIPDKSVAVLPFENLSADPENAYFVEGIQDEILTRLAKVSALKVISRTSTMRYASRPDNLREIVQQLGVANILEGSVQRAAGSVRINVQLIEAQKDSHLWAESYDRDIKNIFSVESEVAQNVADALKATLLPAESVRIASVPTKNPAAYDLFLKGQYFFGQLQTSATKDPVADGKTATDMYRRAVAADPDFALAYARLSYLQSYLHWYGVDHGSAVIEEARAAAEKALALQPDLPEAHLAMGYFHYWCHRDYAAALREYGIARAALPNDAEVIAAIGYVHRRQGIASRGIPEMQQASVLDPRDPLLPREIANSFTALRRYAEADVSYARSLAIFPGDVEAQEQRAASMMFMGDMAGAARILAGIPADTDPQGSASLLRYKMAMIMRKPDEALAAIAHSPNWLMTRWEHSLAPLSLLRGEALTLKGDADPARSAFLEAEQQLQGLLDKPHEVADAQSYLGLVYAGLGQKEAALKAGHAAVDLLPMSRDVIVGAFHLERLAQVEAQVGETQSAIEHLEELMSSSAGEVVSIATLRIDPAWDLIREDPRFKALLAKHAVSESDTAHE